jgi:hypothetical protein
MVKTAVEMMVASRATRDVVSISATSTGPRSDRNPTSTGAVSVVIAHLIRTWDHIVS